MYTYVYISLLDIPSLSELHTIPYTMCLWNS